MSIAGAIAIKGATVTVRRLTAATNTDGSGGGSWGDQVTGVKVLLEHQGEELSQRLWGKETTIDLIARIDRSAEVREGDVLVVTAAGTPAIVTVADRYRVVRKIDQAFGGSSHSEWALAKAQSAEGV